MGYGIVQMERYPSLEIRELRTLDTLKWSQVVVEVRSNQMWPFEKVGNKKKLTAQSEQPAVEA